MVSGSFKLIGIRSPRLQPVNRDSFDGCSQAMNVLDIQLDSRTRKELPKSEHKTLQSFPNNQGLVGRDTHTP